LVLSTLNEMAEAWVRKKQPGLWGSPESTHDAFMDIVATLAGWKLADFVAKRLA